jgi:hypothetical protein
MVAVPQLGYAKPLSFLGSHLERTFQTAYRSKIVPNGSWKARLASPSGTDKHTAASRAKRSSAQQSRRRLLPQALSFVPNGSWKARLASPSGTDKLIAAKKLNT